MLLYHKIQGKVLDSSKVNWDETRVIFISPHFTVHQKMASQFTGLPIELYEVSRYKNGLILLDKIENEVDTDTRKTRTHTPIKLQEYSEEEYLAGEYGQSIPSEEVRKLYLRIKNLILDNFPEIESQQKKKSNVFSDTESMGNLSILVNQRGNLHSKILDPDYQLLDAY